MTGCLNSISLYKTDGSNGYIPGDKTLNSTMNYNQLIAALTTEYVENEQVSITIPEGYTVDEIIDLLVGKGIGTREGYVEAINSYPYQHEFVQELDKNGYPESRKYRLEGYLYPDTYFFYKTSPRISCDKRDASITLTISSGVTSTCSAPTSQSTICLSTTS